MARPKDVYDLLKIRQAVKRARYVRWAVTSTLFAVLAFLAYYSNSHPQLVYINDPDEPGLLLRSAYAEVEYAAPTALTEYQNTLPQEPADRNCGPRFALLVHEPHTNVAYEKHLFYLLKFLQTEYPVVFRKLTIIQEGQISHTQQQTFNALLWDNAKYSNIASMLRGSRRAWDAAHYSPLNRLAFSDDVDEAIRYIDYFTRSTLSTGAEFRVRNMLEFYKTTRRDGALDTQSAFLERIEALADHHALERPLANRLIDHFRSISPENEKFAKFAIEDLGLRGAHAYELFVEGFRAVGSPTLSVDTYGLDDIGPYLASCLAAPSCLGDEHRVDYGELHWFAIQPSRDAEMTDNALAVLDHKPEDTIPLILASAGTHLPLVRELLCQQGFDTVSLFSKEESWWGGRTGTTPLSRFFGDDILGALRDYGDQLE